METSAARDSRPGEALVSGHHPHRQATTSINGLDRTLQDQLDSNRYMAWLGGQLTLQSQSRTGGFQKPRDVVSTSYYDRLMSEHAETLERIKRLKEQQKVSDSAQKSENVEYPEENEQNENNEQEETD